MSDSGHVWIPYNSGQASSFSVDGDEGLIAGAAFDSIYTQADITAGDVEQLAKIRLGSVPSAGTNVWVSLAGRLLVPGTSYHYYANFFVTNSNIELYIRKYTYTLLDLVGPYSIKASAYTPGDYYWLKFLIQGTALKAKAWKDGDAEPGSWQLSTTDSDVVGSGRTAVHKYSPSDGYVAYIAEYSATVPVVTGTEYTDSSTVTLTLTPALTEEYTPASGTVYTDADTIYLDLTASGSDAYFSTEPVPVTDTWTRSVTDAWGVSDSGHEWTQASGNVARLAVNGSVGRMQNYDQLTASRGPTVTLSPVYSDVDILVRARLRVSDGTALPVSGGVEIANILGRYQDVTNHYNTRLEYESSDGLLKITARKRSGTYTNLSSEITVDSSYALDEWIWVRVNHDGANYKAKAWKDGDTEPSSWMIEETDSTWETGKVGLSCHAYDPTYKYTTEWDDLAVTPIAADVFLDSGTIPLTLGLDFVEDYSGADIYEDAATAYLKLTPSGVELLEHLGTEYIDANSFYVKMTPSGAEFVHRCRGRYRGTLTSWTYDPDGMYSHWAAVFHGATWRGELIPVEAVVNYDC